MAFSMSRYILFLQLQTSLKRILMKENLFPKDRKFGFYTMIIIFI